MFLGTWLKSRRLPPAEINPHRMQSIALEHSLVERNLLIYLGRYTTI